MSSSRNGDEHWRKANEGKEFTEVCNLVEEMAGSEILIRGRVHTSREFPTRLFIVLRKSGFTVQLMATRSNETEDMIKVLSQITRESVLDVMGIVSVPTKPLTGTTQPVEIHVREVYCQGRAVPRLPLYVEDASRSEADIQKSEKDGKPAARVLQDTRLNNRGLDLQTPANQAIIRIECQAKHALEEFFLSQDFVGINTPKIIAGSSEGGSAVFKLDYMGQPACLAQSPQLHKQMAICADFSRVFVSGPVFRAERSFTHRHLCEFIGFDVEMEIHWDYHEVMKQADESILFMIAKLEERCQKLLKAVGKQYPSEPLKLLPKTLVLTHAEVVQMLKEAGEEVDPLGDLNTELERKLGKLIREKYNTDFYIVDRFPLKVRPFYTMPCADDPRYSNSFDVFLRGEEIISGGQRIHDPEFLEIRARECGINVETISTYIDSFRYGAPPHGGFGVGLERVVMLLLGLDNIRKASLFPRDPQRLAP